jgi:DNA invertase Pin-like site-specific DNA recombinase
LQQALDAVCETGGILVIYSLSRLSRSVADTLQIAEQLRDAGAELASLSERIDTSSAGGRMIFTMLSAFSAFERELTAERTSAALQFKKSQGERTGTIPFGFSLAADGVQLVPVPEQQQAIQLIQQLREEGWSYRAIAQKLEAAGVKTSKGKAAWSAKVIRDLAARPA